MGNTEDFLRNNAAFAEHFDKGDLPLPPILPIAIVACMDARMNIGQLLGLSLGDAHIIRNAGGIVSDDVIRSLMISQRILGTREIMLIHHTNCGMMSFRDEELSDAVFEDTGVRPPFGAGTFADLEESVRNSIKKIKDSPFIPHTDAIRGFGYDIETGRLSEIS